MQYELTDEVVSTIVGALDDKLNDLYEYRGDYTPEEYEAARQSYHSALAALRA